MNNKLKCPQSFLIFAMLNILTLGCFAQISPSLIPNILPAAPNTTSLYKFENYSVNLYSGIPDISIPLYEIKMGSVTVPITLKYHASGIKVAEKAGWVGLGWALTTGGAISRRIMGGADEGSNGYLKGNLRQSRNINITYPEAPDLNYVASVAKGDRDAQPDIYSYSFSGKSGKFFFDGTDGYEPKLVPYAPVKIEPGAPGPNSLSFRIKDEQGYTYIFGEQARERTQTSNGGNSSTVTSAWKLEKIYAPNMNDSISYSYSSSSFVNYNDHLDIISVGDRASTPTTTPVYSYSSPSGISRAVSTYVNELKNDEIHFKNGKIVFELSSNHREDLDTKNLKKIKVFRGNAQDGWSLIKEIEFITSYFIKGTDTSTKRLRLDAVKIKGNENLMEETYRFQYQSKALPSYTSKAKDYWGYYNGKANNTLVPRMQINVTKATGFGTATKIWIGSNISDSREPDETFMKAGTLKRIVYPTGGYSDFEFETNRYTNSNGETKLAGGLRIRSIKSYSGTDDTTPISKFYEYNTARPNFHLANYVFTTRQTYKYYHSNQGGPPGFWQSKRVRHFVSNPTIDIVPYDGIPVSYPKVTEYLKAGNIPNGKTVYEYRDHRDVNASTAVSFITGKPFNISKFYARGQPSLKTVYNYNAEANTYEKQKETAYRYSAFPQTRYNGVGLIVVQGIVIEGGGRVYGPGARDERYSFANYGIDSDDNYLVSKTETWYNNPSSPISTTTNYHYENIVHQQISRTETIDSKGDINITEFHYPDDIVNNTQLGYDALTASERNVIEQMKWDEDHLTGVPIQTEKTKKDENGNILSESAQRTIFKSNNGMVLKERIQTSKNRDPLENRVLYRSYDNQGNPTEISLIDGPSIIYLWGYDKEFPIAKIENATYSEVANELGISVGDLDLYDEDNLAAINALRGNLSKTRVTTYTYEPLVGVTSITDPKGQTITYHYDAFNRLEFVKDEAGNILKEHKYHYKELPNP